jgi:hypothetical protein
MSYFVALMLGGLILVGLAWVSTSLDKLSKEMSRANDLKEAQLRSHGVSVPTPGPEIN